VKTKTFLQPAARFLCLTLLVLAQVAWGQGLGLGFYTTLTQIYPVEESGAQLIATPIAYLSGNALWTTFGNTSNYWLPSIHIPATSTDPAVDLQFNPPSVFFVEPYHSVCGTVNDPGGEFFNYGGEFVLSDNQTQLVLAGQATLVLTQDVSSDPSIQPEVVKAALLNYAVMPIAAPQIVRPGNVRLNWQSDIGLAYLVQFKNQINDTSWTDTDITVIATSGNSIVDIPMAGASGFYRVIQVGYEN
jgi:hypothetical protein